MKGLMYFIAGVFAVLAVVVAAMNLSFVTLIGGICGASVFALIGYISEV